MCSFLPLRLAWDINGRLPVETLLDVRPGHRNPRSILAMQYIGYMRCTDVLFG